MILPNLGIGGHQSTVGRTDEWLTPPRLLYRLGPFDLDPCAPVDRPWPTAARHYTIDDDGLSMHWSGRIWLNPPYRRYQIGAWLRRLARHGDGVALVFARTETDWFHAHVWGAAAAVLFLRGRIRFYRPDGSEGETNAGAPSALIAYGSANVGSIERSGLGGKLVRL